MKTFLLCLALFYAVSTFFSIVLTVANSRRVEKDVRERCEKANIKIPKKYFKHGLGIHTLIWFIPVVNFFYLTILCLHMDGIMKATSNTMFAELLRREVIKLKSEMGLTNKKYGEMQKEFDDMLDQIKKKGY